MIIGITGTNGSGKGTVVEYLMTKGYKQYSNSALITEEVVRRGMPVNRDSMRIVGNDLRQLHGPAYVTEINFRRAQADGGDAVIEALRAIGEAEFLKSERVPLIAVDADRHTRYARIVDRGSAKDQVTFDEFCLQEDKEMSQTAANEMNISEVMKMADYTITNNGTLEELHTQIDAVLNKIRK